jgi:hypothetical protein
MTDTVISQNIDLCTWDILYIPINWCSITGIHHHSACTRKQLSS